MEEDMKKVYSEVIAALRLVDDEEKLAKLPMEFVELIRSKADATYMPELSKDKSLEEQNLNPKTYSILAWIANKFWGEELPQESEEKEIYVYNDLDIDLENIGVVSEKNNLPMVISKLNWFEKIKIKINLIVNKLFKKRKYEKTVMD